MRAAGTLLRKRHTGDTATRYRDNFQTVHDPALISSVAGSAESGVEDWMGARLTAALLAGRVATGLSRRLGRGGGTVIAGHVVPRIDPTALRTVTRRLRHGSVLVSGTNGKTTTSRLISHLLRRSSE